MLGGIKSPTFWEGLERLPGAYAASGDIWDICLSISLPKHPNNNLIQLLLQCQVSLHDIKQGGILALTLFLVYKSITVCEWNPAGVVWDLRSPKDSGRNQIRLALKIIQVVGLMVCCLALFYVWLLGGGILLNLSGVGLVYQCCGPCCTLSSAPLGALDAAICCNVNHGGWCPKGRKQEKRKKIPDKYQLQEMNTGDYLKRTEANVIDSEATLILTSVNYQAAACVLRSSPSSTASPVFTWT